MRAFIFLTVLDCDPKNEGLIEMPCQEYPNKPDSVLIVKRGKFPIDVAEGILKESSNVLECSPLLGHVSWLSC